MLDGYIEELEFNDITNREGHAAKVYFNALFSKGFTRSDDTPLNAMLNYGYINVLVITSSKPKKISGFEEIHIIDYDLCLIDTCDN